MMLSRPGLDSLTQSRPLRATGSPRDSAWMVFVRRRMKSVKYSQLARATAACITAGNSGSRE